ncbi:hypothetical protein NL460_29575, partial [Klebsiella pneumoniae]|nr:hypothetical protein [Klebsiella pneumoniae]
LPGFGRAGLVVEVAGHRKHHPEVLVAGDGEKEHEQGQYGERQAEMGGQRRLVGIAVREASAAGAVEVAKGDEDQGDEQQAT